MTSQLQTEFIRFVIIAIIRTGLDMVMWKVFVIILQKNPALARLVTTKHFNEYTVAHVVAVCISIAISYIANSRLVFTTTNPNWLREVSVFIGVSVFSLVLSSFIMQLFTENQKLRKLLTIHPLIEKHWPFLVRLSAIGVTIVTNFLGYRFLAFG